MDVLKNSVKILGFDMMTKIDILNSIDTYKDSRTVIPNGYLK